MTIPRLAAVIEHERDSAMRRAMTLQRDRLRLEAAGDALEEALAMIPLLEAGAAAVAREVAVEDPVRASMLRTGVGSRLSARRQDLQQQLIVMRQASATLDLVADGQARLVEALDRARNITIGAAHTAVAARRVLGADAIPHGGRAGPTPSLNGVVARLNAVVDRLEHD
ncbi:toxic anion resistance protein TelA [Sphingomonas sp. PP-CC-3G-468]|nr:toxic anion resistance protein TelA [Sphingomonas sp. PP-CC-3G-468]